MTYQCDLLEKCGYFEKYQGYKETPCQGPRVDECKRKAYHKKHGNPPPIDMMPSGHMMVTHG